MNKYIIGSSPIPDWCASALMPYIGSDSSTHYEYKGHRKTYELRPGDALTLSGGRVSVEYQKR